MNEPYRLDEKRDPDLWPYRDNPAIVRALLEELCRCGHRRKDHMAATGSLGSFGGSACNDCWSCGTFTPATPQGTAINHADIAWARRVLGQ